MKKLFILFIAIAFTISLKAQVLIETATNFTVTTTAGEEITLYDILDQDIIVLIDFFSTTCSGCNTYAPQFQIAYENFGCNTGNVFFIGIERQHTKQETIDFDELHGIEYPSVAGQEGGYEIFQDYQVASTPSLCIIDPDRTIQVGLIWPPLADNITSNLETFGGVQQPCNQGIFGNKFDALDISISPNPARDYIQIRFNSEDAGEYKASITNVTGEIIKEVLNYQTPGEANFKLNLNEIPTGMYILFLSRNEELISSEKLMIVK